jgi:hypothetical protein
MTRNLKTLGLALVAVFAMAAMYASTASAQNTKGWLTSDGPVTLEGTDTVGEKSKLTFIHEKKLTGEIECHGKYTVGKVGSTPHDVFLNLGTTTTSFTVTPHYTACTAKIGAAHAYLTVTMNGCDYVLTLGTTTGVESRYGGTADIICPVGKVIEIHAYSDAAHKNNICTYTVLAQTGKTGGFAQNSGETVTLGGPIKGITAVRHKTVLCGNLNTHTSEAELDIHALLQGTNEEGKETKIFITESGV